MPVHLREVVGYLDATLEIDRFRDFAPNGLQVEGTAEVECAITGVSASAELIGAAIERRADLIVVEAAAGAGCELFLTGELAERAGDLAKELQITLVAAGHHATEVFGPIRIADELRQRFPGLDVSFVASPSPL